MARGPKSIEIKGLGDSKLLKGEIREVIFNRMGDIPSLYRKGTCIWCGCLENHHYVDFDARARLAKVDCKGCHTQNPGITAVCYQSPRRATYIRKMDQRRDERIRQEIARNALSDNMAHTIGKFAGWSLQAERESQLIGSPVIQQTPAATTRGRGKNRTYTPEMTVTRISLNPKRRYTEAWKRYNLIKDGLTVQECLNAGVWYGDLRGGVERGFLAIS